ncbi:MAG TPA: hypothetical protein DD458_24085 [Prolixibacteraceae bacterium]|nr:hypothetical protein [Prolixibacteraceae bacterium]
MLRRGFKKLSSCTNAEVCEGEKASSFLFFGMYAAFARIANVLSDRVVSFLFYIHIIRYFVSFSKTAFTRG